MSQALQESPVTFTADQYIPMKAWSRDHWRQLIYMDTVITDLTFFEVGYDPRMTHNRRNYRVMLEQNPKPKRMGKRVIQGPVMEPRYKSRLAEGFEAPDNHDDWCAVQDMAAEGLFTVGPDSVEPKTRLKFSDKGYDVLNQLRRHKQTTGSCDDFAPTL